MPDRWRTQTTSFGPIVVEACWRPMEGDVAGDFHDLVDLKDGRVLVAIGDAPGHGPRAAELADDLRAGLRRAFRLTHDAPAALSRLDQDLRELRDDAIATVACIVVDPAEGRVDVASAGHLPVLCVDGGGARLLERRADPPVGVPQERGIMSHPLPPDASLFLYTDGLVERRGEPLDQSLRTLVSAAEGLDETNAWASELARRAVERLGPPTDDATVVSVRLAERFRPRVLPGGVGLPTSVLLRVYVDRADLRSSQTEAVVRALASRARGQLDVKIEVADIRSVDADGELDGILAAPTIVRVAPPPLVRVIGAVDSPVELARALQLPLPEEAARP